MHSLSQFCPLIFLPSSYFHIFVMWQIHTDETKSSLQFASRALRVTNCATVNEVSSKRFSYLESSFISIVIYLLLLLLFWYRMTFK